MLKLLDSSSMENRDRCYKYNKDLFYLLLLTLKKWTYLSEQL